MRQLLRQQRLRSNLIGFRSNFERVDLDNLLDNGSVPPMVNQVLAHVGNTPFDLIDYSRSKGLLVEAYSPVAHGAALKNAQLGALAQRYGVSIAQLCIRYCLQLGLLPLPKTANAAHMRDNAAVERCSSGWAGGSAQP